MKKYTVKEDAWINGELTAVGSVVDIADVEAEILLAEGIIKVFEDKEADDKAKADAKAKEENDAKAEKSNDAGTK